MTDWEVKVRLHSGEIKTCVMEDYITRRDAEAAALNSTGAKSIFTPGTPIRGKGIVVNMDGGVGGSWAEIDYDDNIDKIVEEGENRLDEMELEMYNMLCERAVYNREELPTIDEFYDWLEN